MNPTATYSPEDNKLRLYPVARLDSNTYSEVKAAGFKWAPKQQLFVAPMWTPAREDLLIRLCGSIEDEDKTLVQRSEERAERFETYRDNRAADAESARQRVDSIVKHIPFGQPILVGHHSERRARKDALRVDDGMRKTVKMWNASEYWEQRAQAAIQAAKYKERPEVRARRIKKLEAEERKWQRLKSEAERFITAWSNERLTMERAAGIASYDHGKFLSAERRTDGKPYPVSLWDATQGNCEPKPSLEEIATKAIQNHQTQIGWIDQWLEHLKNRLAYERAMLAQEGGIAASRTTPEVGGACQCWASPRGGWSLIKKVNKVSVTVLDNWGNGGADFTRTIPFDKLRAVMNRAEVDAARQEGRIIGEKPLGFHLLPKVQASASNASSSMESVSAPGIQTPHGPLLGTGVPPSRDSLRPGIPPKQTGLNL
jgi:hypothetical protein